jgi:Transposase DNA-binding
MEVAPSLKRNFGQEHFASVQLGDQRRNRRLRSLAQRLIEHPTGTLPKRMKDHAELTALYRLMDCQQVTHEAVLQPHRQRTLELMRQQEVVLILHDSTELDYSSKTSLKALGQIGNGSRRGYVCHNSLVWRLRSCIHAGRCRRGRPHSKSVSIHSGRADCG